MFNKRIIISSILILFSVQADAEVFKWKDASGKTHYGDKPREGGSTNVEVKVKPYTKTSLDKASIKPEVVMYSTSWCGYCKKARQYFRKNNIAFSEYDIEKNKSAKREYDELGGNGVPVILYDGKRMNGFSETSFVKLYSPNSPNF